LRDRHFPEGAHNKEDGDAADRIGEQDPGPGQLDSGCRTEKQTDPDCRPQGHHVDVPLPKPPVQLGCSLLARLIDHKRNSFHFLKALSMCEAFV